MGGTVVSPENEGELLNAATLRWLNEFASQGIFTTDAQLRVESWNRWLEQHSGVAAESAIGRRLFDIFPEIALRGFEAHYRAALAGESRVLAHTFHKFLIPAAASTPEPAQTARIAPLLVGGRVAGTITWIEDVSERVATERELRHQIEAAEFSRTVAEDALRTKDEFLATLSHEIRTPLNAVLGWTKILLARDVDQALRRRALEVIDRNAVAQMHMVEDMLDMARIMTGKLRIDVQPVNVLNVVQAALDVVAPTALAREIRLEPSLSIPETWVAGDADRLQQIIWNLLSNAIKFTDSGGLVRVELDRTGDVLQIVIADTGVGIDPEFLPFMFERFRQAHASSSRRHGGLGIGLPLVRQLVELHGGSVTATSTVGVGSTFTVKLPVMPEAARVTFSQDPTEQMLEGLRVMVVERERDSREMMAVALEQYGAVVLQADSTPAALALLDGVAANEEDLAAVIVDAVLAEDDGYRLLGHASLAGSGKDSEVPVIALAPYRNPLERQSALLAGFRTCLARPVAPDALIETLLTVTSRRRSR
jgi:signal transduction histidine kinase